METKNIIVVYKTDAHHSYNSRDIIGVATNVDMAIFICKQQAKKEGEKFTSNDMFNLMNIKQTQGYCGKGEFDYETIQLNKLI